MDDHPRWAEYLKSIPFQAKLVQDDILAGELRLHQGGLRHAPPEDGRVDGERREGETEIRLTWLLMYNR